MARISWAELVLAVSTIRGEAERDLIEKYSPALCELIYRAHQRERLRDKLMDLDLRAAAAANSGFVKNAGEILSDARSAIEDMLSQPLLPED